MDANVEPLRSLEARYYTDPAIFELETNGLLSRTWQYAGHASQCENVGDYFTFQIAGQNLFCIKDKDGVIRASRSQDMVAAIKAAGGSPKYTELKGVGHNAWKPAWQSKEMWDWLFAQKK